MNMVFLLAAAVAVVSTAMVITRLNAVHALRDAKANVKGMAAIFTYGLDVADKNFKEADCKLVTLSDYQALITEAVEKEYISAGDEASLIEWRKNPQAWSDAHQ